MPTGPVDGTVRMPALDDVPIGNISGVIRACVPAPTPATAHVGAASEPTLMGLSPLTPDGVLSAANIDTSRASRQNFRTPEGDQALFLSASKPFSAMAEHPSNAAMHAVPAAGAAPEQGPDPLIGKLIGDRFRVVSLIARGGMGRVYKAEQAPLGRICAIKVVNAGFGAVDPEFHRRFFLEASISSKLTHPNTVTVFDYGRTDDDIYYMAMELLEGRTMHRALREDGKFTEDRVLHIARQICRSLREAHGHNVIHRDLKPANVFLVTHGDEKDFVKVLDFGLVKNVDERPEEQLTQTGLFMGSPKYMAPEQIEGHKVDGRTDIYSLGVMMYEMLTGRVPFERASSVNTLMAHVHEAVPPLRVTNPTVDVSSAFEALIMRCMAKQPDERFASMDDLLNHLKNIDGLGGSGPYESRSSWRARSPSRHPSASDAHAISSVHLRNDTQALTPVHAGNAGMSQPLTPPMPVRASTIPPAPGYELEAPRSVRPSGPSRGAVLGLVGLAVAIGGGLGYLAYRMTQAPAAQAGRPASSVEMPHAPPSAATVAAPVASPLKEVRFTSEPSGARVQEGAAEICASTPCTVSLEQKDVERTHTLVFSKAGFVAETRQTALTAPVHVFLAKGKAGAAGVPVRPVAPAPSGAKSAEPDESTPAGFKKTPY